MCRIFGLMMIFIMACNTGNMRTTPFIHIPEEETFADYIDEWSRESLPLGVTCEGYNPEDSVRCDVVRQALRAFNFRVGFQFYKWGSENPVVFYVIGFPRLVDSNLFNSTQTELTTIISDYEDYTIQCHIQMNNTSGDDSLLWVFSYHAAGHCAGLDHDPSDYFRSVMRETQPNQLEPYDPFLLPWLTDADRDAIRARYR